MTGSWHAGLNADDQEQLLHHLFGAEPHERWGGGLEWRCGHTNADPGTKLTMWCHSSSSSNQGDTTGYELTELVQLMQEEAMAESEGM